MSGDEGKIFVGGLHWNTSEEGLRAYFEQFGQVIDCKIMRDPTGRSRCFGFVVFADPVVVDIILQKTHILDNKQIDPKRAVPRDQQPGHLPTLPQSTRGAGSGGGGGGGSSKSSGAREEHKVFVGGIHIDADEQDMREYFQRYDDVVEAIIMRDRDTNRSRGFGFVTFVSLEGAQRAFADTEARILGRRVEIKMAVPRGRAPAPVRTDAGGGAASTSAGGDPYAAWAEYFKQYPEYYEAMMKAYSNPAAMAAYYNQYYGGSSSVSAPGGSVDYAPKTDGSPTAGYDPAQYAAMMAALTGAVSSTENPAADEAFSPTGADLRSVDRGRRSPRDEERSPVRGWSPRRSRSPRARSRSPSPNRERVHRDARNVRGDVRNVRDVRDARGDACDVRGDVRNVRDGDRRRDRHERRELVDSYRPGSRDHHPARGAAEVNGRDAHDLVPPLPSAGDSYRPAASLRSYGRPDRKRD